MPSEILERFQRVARDHADDVVLWAPQEKRTLRAADILADADGIRETLRRAGITRGTAVVSSVGNRSAFIALAVACLAEGWPLLAADRATPASELLALVDRWNAAALISGDVPAPSPTFGSFVDLPANLSAALVSPRPESGGYPDAALLKLTSGSTGEPKVTLTGERHLVADVTQIVEAMSIGPRTRQLGVIPLSHSYGFSNLVLPLLWQGSPLLLHPGFVPAQIAADAAAFGAETWAGVPFMFEHVARLTTTPFPASIRTVISAGARLSFDVVEAFHRRTGRKVHSFYGSSETGGICYDASDELSSDVPVGRPIGATVVTLREDVDAPPDSGRVIVRGPAVIAGYAGEDDAEAFAGGGFVTSDFGRFTPEGELILTGRATTVVNIAGRKVMPSEVEAAMRALPDVLEVVVVGVDDDKRGQALGACFVAARPIAPIDLRAALAAHLAAYKLPRVMVQLDELPVTPRGKPDRLAITGILARARGGV